MDMLTQKIAGIRKNLDEDPVLLGLRLQVREQFTNAWNLNDYGHREAHFMEVETTAHYLCIELGLDHDPEAILLAAYFHDLFSWSRHNHHLLSATYVRTTDNPLLDRPDRDLIADGCEFHRGSGKLPFPNQFAELICSADRGVPNSIELVLMRTLQTRFFKEPYMNRIAAMESSLVHVKEKYGSDGYARYPDLYTSVFGYQIEEQKKTIDRIFIRDGLFWVGGTPEPLQIPVPGHADPGN